MLIGSFAFANSNVSVANLKTVVTNIVQENDKLSFTFSNLESLQKFDFKSYLNSCGLEDGQCTVSVSVSYGGASATFSVTADTCEKAGAGAVDAALGFVKRIKAIL